MDQIKAKVILSDIEGTTTSISFVKDILFPFAKKHTKCYLESTWFEHHTQKTVQDLMKLPEYEAFKTEFNIVEGGTSLENITAFVNYLIDKDLKLGPLKTLQGMVWSKGYEDGSIKGHVYEDVFPAFKKWRNTGLDIAIYSSGSVMAQRLLFEYSELGNLLPLIRAHFDTNVGHKQVKESYVEIAKRLDVDAADVVFLTDIVKEAKAAQAAGMQAILLNRPGNAEFSAEDKTKFSIIADFSTLQVIPKDINSLKTTEDVIQNI